jgi:demethylmenaquinone methyltransferase / 2-methoxy-6-polyprenyl-1,4-benzoquinol methylase
MANKPWDAAELPTGEAKVKAVQEMFDTVAPKYDLVNRIMTLRLDVKWRKQTVRTLGLRPGSLVLDLASGTGDLCKELERQGLTPISMDMSFGMLAADTSGSPRVQADVLHLPVPDASCDGVTCGFALRNFMDLGMFFDELARVTRPGGRIALLDACSPENKILKWGHGVYFGKIVPKIGGLISDAGAYRYLPRSLAYLPPPAEMIARLEAAGFDLVKRELLTLDAAQLITATRT